VALDGDYLFTPTKGFWTDVPGYPIVLSDPVNMSAIWGTSNPTWIQGKFLSGRRGIYLGAPQFALQQLNQYTLNDNPAVAPNTGYTFSERPVGITTLSFRSINEVGTAPSVWASAIRISCYTAAGVLVQTASKYSSDITPGANTFGATYTASLDCAGAMVARVAVYIETQFSVPGTLSVQGYGIELSKFYVEDLSSGGGGETGTGWAQTTADCPTWTPQAVECPSWSAQAVDCPTWTKADEPI
jgi:hypothetical protein